MSPCRLRHIVQEQRRTETAGCDRRLFAVSRGYSDIVGVVPGTDEKIRPPSDEAPFSALAFKIMTDPFVGRLSFFRVYSGTAEAGSTVLNSTKGNKERLGRILQMHANHRKISTKVYAGDIAAPSVLKIRRPAIRSAATKRRSSWNQWYFLNPSYAWRLNPKPRRDRKEWVSRSAKLSEEDPTFKNYTDEETGQTIIAGMGELHLEIIVDRLLRSSRSKPT